MLLFLLKFPSFEPPPRQEASCEGLYHDRGSNPDSSELRLLFAEIPLHEALDSCRIAIVEVLFLHRLDVLLS